MDIGIHYWGLNLEFPLTDRQFPWQTPDGIGSFRRLPSDIARQQLRMAMEKAVEKLPDGACAIWSNESLYELPLGFAEEISQTAARLELDVHVIAYARNHRGYVKSAYQQWGVKHKTNRGPIMGFDSWVVAQREFLSYGKKLSVWDGVFGERMDIINYEQVGDVVAHFVSQIPTDKVLPALSSGGRENTSLPMELLLLYALHNNGYEESVLPEVFAKVIDRHPRLHELVPAPDLRGLMVDDASVAGAMGVIEPDRCIVDDLLRKRGQPLMRRDALHEKKMSDTQILMSLVSALFNMLLDQDDRLRSLEESADKKR
jgi:hypothetical protein